jgi:hypothetical protein
VRSTPPAPTRRRRRRASRSPDPREARAPSHTRPPTARRGNHPAAGQPHKRWPRGSTCALPAARLASVVVRSSSAGTPRCRAEPDASFRPAGVRGGTIATPRIRASAPTRVDARFAPPAGGRRTLGINGKHALASGPDVRGGRQALAHECFLREHSSAGRRRFDPAGSRVRPISSVRLPRSARSLFVFPRPHAARLRWRQFDHGAPSLRGSARTPLRRIARNDLHRQVESSAHLAPCPACGDLRDYVGACSATRRSSGTAMPWDVRRLRYRDLCASSACLLSTASARPSTLGTSTGTWGTSLGNIICVKRLSVVADIHICSDF